MGSHPILPFPGCVTQSKFLHLCVPKFLHARDRDIASYLMHEVVVAVKILRTVPDMEQIIPESKVCFHSQLENEIHQCV